MGLAVTLFKWQRQIDGVPTVIGVGGEGVEMAYAVGENDWKNPFHGTGATSAWARPQASDQVLRYGRKFSVLRSAPVALIPVAVFFGIPPRQIEIMKILHFLGALLIILWLVLWLVVKVTFAAIHALLVIGVILIVIAFMAGRSAGSKS